VYGQWACRLGGDASQLVTGCRLAMASLDWAGWVSVSRYIEQHFHDVGR